MANAQSFQVRDCNLALIATGKMAESLVDFKNQLYQIPLSSLYYHFWGARLRLTLAHPEYHNDFARWIHLRLHDEILTERLTIIDPTDYDSLENLREKVIEVVEERLEESTQMPWAGRGNQFHFLRSIIISYDMGAPLTNPADLKELIAHLPLTSIFYHVVDARRRTSDGIDDFSQWFKGCDQKCEDLSEKLKEVDVYFLSLSEIRQRLTELFQKYL